VKVEVVQHIDNLPGDRERPVCVAQRAMDDSIRIDGFAAFTQRVLRVQSPAANEIGTKMQIPSAVGRDIDAEVYFVRSDVPQVRIALFPGARSMIEVNATGNVRKRVVKITGDVLCLRRGIRDRKPPPVFDPPSASRRGKRH